MGPLAYAAEYLPEDEPLLAARANAADLGGTEPVLPAVGATLRFLACAVGARTAVEIGTGCGSSGIWLLRGMRPGSTLTSVDTEPEYQRVARKAFSPAGFAQNQCRLSSAARSTCSPGCPTAPTTWCSATRTRETTRTTCPPRCACCGPAGSWRSTTPCRPGLPGTMKRTLSASDLASQVRADERLVPVLLPLGDGLLAAVKRSD